MSLPVYDFTSYKLSSIADLNQVLKVEMNLKHPCVLNLKHLEPKDQRTLLSHIEHFFVSNNISYKFPYPVYIVTDIDRATTGMLVVKETAELPRFFSQKEGKMNVKEMHLSSKNRLLQQQVINMDSIDTLKRTTQYGALHKKIYDLEAERQFYRSVLSRLTKGKKNG
jgi:hypothetical protein